MITRSLSASLLAALAAACASPPSGPQVSAALSQAMASAELHIHQGNDFEAYELIKAVADVDAEHPGVAERLARLPSHLRAVIDRPLLGANVASRRPVEPTWVERVLWYVPDRVMDALDVLSIDLHAGLGLYVDVHVTRGFQFAAGARKVGGMGWHEHRSLGFQTRTQAGFSLPMLGAEIHDAFLTGTSGPRGGSWSIAGLQVPERPLYQDYRDYWAIGTSVTGVLVGIDVDVHMVQILDLLAGVVTLDPLNDDFAVTSSLEFDTGERRLLEALYRMAEDREILEEYAVWKATHAPLGDGR